MKYLALLFALAGFFVLPNFVTAAEVSDTKAEVIAKHGEPLSRRYMGNEREVWQYPRGQVTFMSGRVFEAVMASEPFVPSIPQVAPVAPRVVEAPVPQAELPIAPTFDKADHDAGTKLAQQLRTSVDFLVASPERQREILRSFKQRYPNISVSDLERSVARAQARPQERVDPRAAELERRAAAAERQAADAQARLNQELERRRQAEAAVACGYGSPSYAPQYTYQRSYVPSYSYIPSYSRGYVPYRTIPQRSYRSGSVRLGSLAFRGGTY